MALSGAPDSRVVEFADRSAAKQKALDLASTLGKLNGSITEGGGNMAGLLAELLFIDEFGGDRSPTYDYDVVMPDGTTVDIKTKRRTVPPEPHYECSISEFNTEQNCDWYYFTSINVDRDRLHFLGGLPPAEYYECSEFHKEGDVDPSNGFVFKDDCHNVPIRRLRQPEFTKTG